jgi:hypothetical protein
MSKSASIFLILAVGAFAFYWYSSPSVAPFVPPDIVVPDDRPKPRPRPMPRPLPEPEPAPRPDEPIIADSYDNALKLANEYPTRLIFIYFHKDNCPYCTDMEEEVFTDSEVQKEIGRYILYECDAPAERALVKKYGITGVPAYRIIDGTERVVKAETGYIEKDEFLKWMKRQSYGMVSPVE